MKVDLLPSPAALRCLAPGLLLLAAVLLLFRDTAVAMVTIWDRSETFAHAFLVPPIVLWLVWRRRDVLATLQPRSAPWVLLPMAGVCLMWLVGELASSNAVTQFALVCLLVLSVPAVFGLEVARALTFPLIFLFFAVPVGEFMVPYMMEWTADFTVAALQFTRIPVYREGLQFVIPTGNWSVVEACSGVRYLIASFMVGTLFAYLNYTSPRRRAVFMLVSLAVPIVANWLRAYLIVMLGHVSGNKLAAGADHLIYGWVFFGIVIGIMFMIGARFSEPEAPVPAPTPAQPARGFAVGGWGVGVVALLMLGATQAAVWQLNREPSGPAPAVALPAPAAGWTDSEASLSSWEPAFSKPSLTVQRTYTEAGGAVALRVAYYRSQSYERKLVSSTNTLTELTHEATWAVVDSGSTTLAQPGGALSLRTASLRGSPSPGATATQRLRVWHVYWVGGRATTSDSRAKLALVFNRLLGRGDDGAAIFISTPLGDTPEAADALLARFVGAHLPALSRSLEAAHAAR
jgi:exosortase A